MQYISLYFFALPILCLFSVSVGLCSGFPRTSSLVLPLLSGTGFWVYLFSSNTETCDEDDDVGVGVVEELADKKGTANGTYFDILQSINSLALFDELWLLTAGPVICTHDLRRASRVKELWEFLQEAQPS